LVSKGESAVAASKNHQTPTPSNDQDPTSATTETPQIGLSRRSFLKTAAATTAAVAASSATAGIVRAAPAQIRQSSSVSLTFWTQFPELRPGFQKILDAFHADFPTITINQVPKPASNYQQIVNTAAAADELPDLFMIPAAIIPTLARSGQLMDLTGKVPNIANVLPIADINMYVDNKLYTVVWGRYTVTMMYNKRMAAKVGIQPPKTWDEWKAQCKKIKDAGITPISLAGDGTIEAFWFTELATAALGDAGYNALAAGKKKFTDPELAETMQFVLDLKPYYQPGFNATKYVDSKALFATEKVLYFEAGTADVPGFRTINPNLQIGVFPFPAPNGKGVSTLSGLSVTVAANPKSNVDAVAKFQNWCVSAKGGAMCSAAINIAPVVKGVVGTTDPVLSQMIKFSQHDHHVWYEEPRLAPGFNIWAQEGGGVWTGRLTGTQLLKLMQKQSDAVKM
jgi:raffinose/stachyose/melibiose transport system substrate-binding protein